MRRKARWKVSSLLFTSLEFSLYFLFHRGRNAIKLDCIFITDCAILIGILSCSAIPPPLFFFITKNRYVFFSLPLIPLQLLGHYESIVQSFRIWSFATYTSKLSHWTIYFSDRVPCSREPTEATNKLSRGWRIKRFWGFVPFIKLLCTFFLLWSYKREIRKQLFSETEATYREVFNLPAFPHRLHRGFSRKNIDLIEQNKLLRKRCKFLKNLCEVSHFLHIFTLCPDLSPMDEGIDEENF